MIPVVASHRDKCPSQDSGLVPTLVRCLTECQRANLKESPVLAMSQAFRPA
jgi:hypothetical protein